MVRIRLKRVGGKKHPFYRIVVADQRAARDGAFIEQIGTYDPFPDPPEIKVDEEKVAQWIKNGAQPSESVTSLLQTTGFLPKVTTAAPVAEKEAPKAAPKAAPTATAVAEAPAEKAPEAEKATTEAKAPAEEAPVAEAAAEEATASEDESDKDSTSD
jgi:small subunit ribosomal protein S16